MLVGCICGNAQRSSELQLYYNTPATEWHGALPMGNGYMGAMVFGGADTEHLQLNEGTLYSGENTTRKNLDINIRPLFDSVYNPIKAQDYDKANDLVYNNWAGSLASSFEPLGDLFLDFNTKGTKTNYKRILDIEKSIQTTSYDVNGVTYTREIFASYPDHVFVIRIHNSNNAPFSINVSYTSPHPTASLGFSEDGVYIKGQAPGYVERRSLSFLEKHNLTDRHPYLFNKDGSRKTNKHVLYGAEANNEGMYFISSLETLKGSSKVVKNKLQVSGNGEIILIFTSTTSFKGYDKSPSKQGKDYEKNAAEILAAAKKWGYAKLLQRHLEDYQKLFNHTRLEIATDTDKTNITSVKRLQDFKRGSDNQFVNLMFQYGRYLLISSSRKGGQAVNLQGLWNKDVVPFCNSNYTLNINTEMNYWPAEVTGLDDCLPPLFDLIKELSITGGEMAKKMYGLPGWAAHHNTSIWREAYPTDGLVEPTAFFWNMSGAWLCEHLWEHYLFTGDTAYLKNYAYPLMKGAATFMQHWLVKDDKGYWITPIGTSPENEFVSPTGKIDAISSSPTMDNAIVYELFKNTIAAAKILDVDKDFSDSLEDKKSKLPPYRIGKRGQIEEWENDLVEADVRHRHLSPLYGLFPGNDLSITKTTELIPAIKKFLELRGDNAPGWALVWRICIWARLGDGNHAFEVMKNLFSFKQPTAGGDGGLYENLFDANPPFLIDGNLGFVASVSEMLLQSQEGMLDILPALPAVWQKGKVTGLHARGGFIVDIDWEKGKVTKIVVKSLLGKECNLKTFYGVKTFQTEANKTYAFSF